MCDVHVPAQEVTLVLLVFYWGTTSMIQYLITMTMLMVGWRGCRKLKSFFIICFLLYLALDMVLIFLFLVLGFVEGHESVYGSSALYLSLLSFEFVLNVLWLFWYCKFFIKVVKAPKKTLERAVAITSKQPICI